MALYTCDGCLEEIPASKARFHCERCDSHNVCANCYVVGIFTKSHVPQHVTTMITSSGTIAIPLPGPPPLPPRSAVNQQTPATPTSNTQQIPRRPVNTQGSPQEPPSEQQQPAPSQEGGWQPLFNGSQATPTMIAFFNAIFTCLDTENIGLLSPEQYTAFCDVQGFTPDEHIWKGNAAPQFGIDRHDVADYEMRTVYENWSIDHTLHKRTTAPNRDMENLYASFPSVAGMTGSAFSNILKNSIQQSSLSGGMMPMISRKGFIEIMSIDIAGEPSVGWQRLNRMARHYNVWRQRGDVPREMLPEFPPPDLLARIEKVAAYSKQQAEQRLEANRVRLEIEKRGRENALQLLNPPGTRYVYRY